MISFGTVMRIRWSSSSLRLICWSRRALSSSASSLMFCCFLKSSISELRMRSMSKIAVARSSSRASVMMLASRTSWASCSSWLMPGPGCSWFTCANSAFWRSSNSPAVMMRLLILATISSTTAARAGGAPTAATAAASRAAARPVSLIAVFAGVAEREDGAVDMDLGLASQVGQVALHDLIGLLPEQVRLDRGAHLRQVGARFLALHQLEDDEARRLAQHRAHAVRLQRADRGAHVLRQVLGRVGARLAVVGGDALLLRDALESSRLDHDGPARVLGGALIFQHDLAQDKALVGRGRLGPLPQLVLDLLRADVDGLEDRGLLDLLQDEAVADLGAEGLLPVGRAGLEVALGEAELLEVGIDLGLRHDHLEVVGLVRQH